MSDRSNRVLWLLNHVTLMKTEIPILLSMGYEVFTPKIIPAAKGFRSGAVDFSFDRHLTLPPNVLEVLNSADLYQSEWPDEVVQYINEYFSVMFFIPLSGLLEAGLKYFRGAVLLRVFGMEQGARYIDMLNYNYSDSLRKVYEIRDRFWFATAYEQITEVEPKLLSDRKLFLPIGLPSSFDVYRNTWIGSKKQILFICPSIESIPLYKQAYIGFKKAFGHLPHVIAGSQPVPVDDPHVLGFVSDETLIELFQQSSVLYYHSHEPRHVHYHPIEAAAVGMPVIIYDDSLIARMAGRAVAGFVSSLEQAKDIVESILAGDSRTIELVKKDQEIIRALFSESHCAEVWKKNFAVGPLAEYMNAIKNRDSEPDAYCGHVPRKMILLPGEELDAAKTIEDGISFQNRNYPAFVEYVDGLSVPEDEWGAWSDGGTIEIGLSQPLRGRFELLVSGGAYAANIGADITVTIGSSHRSLRFESEPWHPTTQSAIFDLAGPAQKIEILIPHPTLTVGAKERNLGIGISRIWTRPVERIGTLKSLASFQKKKPKRIAFLNNHNTAAAFVMETCKRNGIEVYIPVKCPERGSLKGAEAAKARKLSIPRYTLEALDSVDLYAAGEINWEFSRIIDRYFDAVIIPGVMCQGRFPDLVNKLNTKVIILEWGNIGGITLHPFWKAYHNRPNVEIAVSYEDFGPNLQHLPLGLKEVTVKKSLVDKFKEPTFLTIISRLGYGGYSDKVLIDLLSKAKEPNANLVVMGKDHADVSAFAEFGKNWRSLTFKSDLDDQIVYETMQRAHGLIYPSSEATLIQYTTLESLYLGTPIIYKSSTFASRFIPTPNDGRILDFDDVGGAIRCLSNPDRAKATLEAQLLLLNILSGCDEKWRTFFRSL